MYGIDTVRILLAVAAGGVGGWLIAVPPEAFASFSWLAFFGTVGTVATAIVATWLGVREGLIRREEKDLRNVFAQACLWPEWRRYLSAINRLKKPPSRRKEPVAELVRRLEVDQWVRDSVKDLGEGDFKKAVSVIAYLQHARRHLYDLDYAGHEYPAGDKAKVKAIHDSLEHAGKLIVPLAHKWRRA